MNFIAFETDRKANGITLKEIAEELNVSERTLSRMLDNPDAATEEKILNAVERLKALK